MDELPRISREADGATLYGQVIQSLRERIEDNTYGPGSRLPSENQLAARFHVSRPVVRQALQILEDQGYIHRVHGRGTFVATPGLQSRLMQVAIGPERDTLRYSARLNTSVLLNETGPAPAAIAREMHLGPGAAVVHLRRVRFLDGNPLAVLDSYIPLHLAPALGTVDLTDQSLYEHLQTRYGHRIAKLRRSIGVSATDDEVSLLLGVPKASPYLLVTSLAMLPSGEIIEDSTASYRGDKITLVTELEGEVAMSKAVDE